MKKGTAIYVPTSNVCKENREEVKNRNSLSVPKENDRMIINKQHIPNDYKNILPNQLVATRHFIAGNYRSGNLNDG